MTSHSIEINFAAPVISNYLDDKYTKKLVYEVSIVSVEDGDKIELKSTHFSNLTDEASSKSIFTSSFNELDPDKEYEICVSTNYNGQEVAKSVTKILKTLPDPSAYV